MKTLRIRQDGLLVVAGRSPVGTPVGMSVGVSGTGSAVVCAWAFGRAAVPPGLGMSLVSGCCSVFRGWSAFGGWWVAAGRVRAVIVGPGSPGGA